MSFLCPFPWLDTPWAPAACTPPTGPARPPAQNSLLANVVLLVSKPNHRNTMGGAFGARKAFVWTKTERITQRLSTTKQEILLDGLKTMGPSQAEVKAKGNGQRKLQRDEWCEDEAVSTCYGRTGARGCVFSLRSLGDGDRGQTRGMTLLGPQAARAEPPRGM